MTMAQRPAHALTPQQRAEKAAHELREATREGYSLLKQLRAEVERAERILADRVEEVIEPKLEEQMRALEEDFKKNMAEIKGVMLEGAQIRMHEFETETLKVRKKYSSAVNTWIREVDEVMTATRRLQTLNKAIAADTGPGRGPRIILDTDMMDDPQS
jgi:hypothetical protein